MTNLQPLPESRAILDGLLAEDAVRSYLRRLRVHHEESWEHSLRVGPLSTDLGIENGVGPDDGYVLCYAGLLHDIGKLRIPQEVLQHHGLLDPAGREVMREHSRLGFEEIAASVPDRVRRLVVAHHEFCRDPYPRSPANGDGFERPEPDRRTRDPRTLRLAEMLAVADMFDALIHRRRYKPALSPAETGRLLRQEFSGDPRYVHQLLERYAGG